MITVRKPGVPHLQHSLGAVHVPDLPLPHIDALSRMLRHKAA